MSNLANVKVYIVDVENEELSQWAEKEGALPYWCQDVEMIKTVADRSLTIPDFIEGLNDESIADYAYFFLIDITTDTIIQKGFKP